MLLGQKRRLDGKAVHIRKELVVESSASWSNIEGTWSGNPALTACNSTDRAMFDKHLSPTTNPTARFLKTCLLSTVLLAACSAPSLREDAPRPGPSYASEPATEGVLAEIAAGYCSEFGPEYSGFRLLDESYDSLEWRLALIDSATTSLDVQTYLWYPDNSGRLILQRSVEAANRGVRVRLIIDDLLTIGLDQAMYELHNHPNIELRLFNPWQKRGALSRMGEVIAQLERLNQRMHDKLIIADGNAAIVGGRNIGDHYFGLGDVYNFHDLDVLGFGHVARQANDMFDHFWNSEWVASASNINTEHDPEFARQRWQAIQEITANAEELQSFGTGAQDWRERLLALRAGLHPGTSVLVYDTTTDDRIEQNVGAEMFGFMSQAQEELLITNAYIIPGPPGIDFIRGLVERGVKVRILTNSLASHDVPAVNSHYEKWRDDFLEAGAELYELRADAAIRPIVDTPPMEGAFVGLHTKAVVVDRQKVFIGSMNFDPRSFNINTEAGVFVDSPGLAEALAAVMERDMHPDNAWQVLLDDKGKLYWVNSDETVHRQPARGGSQRVMNKIFKVIPKEQN
jgi:putative cardiolipin synthase